MLTLVRQARRRIWNNELLSQGANTFSAALFALVLLLLAGTQVLDWRWALLLPSGAAAAGLFLARRRLPSQYAVAQIVDHRMDLADSLSTALFFSQGERSSQVSAEIRKCQFEHANRLSLSVDPRKAIPYTVPRSVYLVALLALIASSLFALRYGLTRRLDLKPPLARILQQQFGATPRTDVAEQTRRAPPPPDAPEDGASVADPDQQPGEQDASGNDTEAGGDQQADQKSGQASQKSRKQGDNSDSSDQEPQAEQRSDSKDGNPSGSEQKGNQKSDDGQQSGNRQDASSGDNSSLLSKVKDAFQNLLSHVKPQQNGSNGQQQSGDQNNKQNKGQQNGGKQQQSAKDGQPKNGDQQGDSQDGQSGEQAQSSQDPQGNSPGKSDSQQASKQPGSGIGSQDGDKTIKQAEQLAAMGKITELLGKRSANITGEATVEVQSTTQQLHTPYAQRTAQHTEGGAEINRDEVSVALQPYVEQYFEQVRKQKK